MSDMQIAVPCAKCSKTTMKMLSELEMSDSVVCPHCGAVEDITKQYWRDALAEGRKALTEFTPKTGK